MGGMNDASVVAYLRERAVKIAKELADTRREARRLWQIAGVTKAQGRMGPAAHVARRQKCVAALKAAIDALDGEWVDVRAVDLSAGTVVLRSEEMIVFRLKLDPQPPSAESTKGTPYGFHKTNGSATDAWSIGGSVGVVRDMVGQSEWRCPLGHLGEVVLIDEEWWEVVAAHPERLNGTGDWYWYAVYRRAEMASPW